MVSAALEARSRIGSDSAQLSSLSSSWRVRTHVFEAYGSPRLYLGIQTSHQHMILLQRVAVMISCRSQRTLLQYPRAHPRPHLHRHLRPDLRPNPLLYTLTSW